jgi:hypothetical protein
MRTLRSIIVTGIIFVGSLTACCAEELSDPALDRLLRQVKEVYGVNVHYAEGPPAQFADLYYSLADARDIKKLRKAVALFIQEINLYPRDFFRDARCQDIYFVKGLFYEKKPTEGIFSLNTNFIFYDYARSSGNTHKIRHSIHHELYHVIGSKHPFWNEHGVQWETLNSSEFSYGVKRGKRASNPVNIYAPSELGFVTEYAMVSAEEDRAEVFAYMMRPDELRLVEQWAQKDTILFKKVTMMKEFLKVAFKQ